MRSSCVSLPSRRLGRCGEFLNPLGGHIPDIAVRHGSQYFDAVGRTILDPDEVLGAGHDSW
jgi:hypothetical protein